jgi:hypothetical protein
MKVSSGCAIHDESIVKSTAASTAIKNHGLTFINTTHPRYIEAPVLGCRKDLVFHGTTKAMKVRTIGALINNSTDDVLTVTITSSTAKHKGHHVTLFGASTVLWYMGAEVGQLTLKLTSTT